MTPLKTESFDVVVPIPLHWTRYAWRGFNQACEMGAAVAKARGVPLARFLARTRRTTFQSRLKADERRKNVSQVFGVNPWYRVMGDEVIRGKHVLLVDDLCTTGATLSQAAKIIAKHKPASITALVACRAV
jgi:ComF family protein